MAKYHDANCVLSGIRRRQFTEWAAASTAGLLSGCATPSINPPNSPGGVPNNIATLLKPVVRKSAAAPALCIDVHAHFFNATDVPVKGFVEGPVAHEKGGLLGKLIAALGPVAGALSHIAPSALDELQALKAIVTRHSLLQGAERDGLLPSLIPPQQRFASEQFYAAVKGTEFEQIYNQIVRTRAGLRGPGVAPFEADQRLSPTSVESALQIRTSARGFQGGLPPEKARDYYAEGVLAFVGFMLSPRWANLYEYSVAYSSASDAFGIDHTFGALVDFEYWLEDTPPSSQQDQIELHRLLSQLSGGYMRPLVGYNPRRDFYDNGATTKRVIDAVKNKGFVGAKIYPPNGFRPYGNASAAQAMSAMRPPLTPEQLDKTLGDFWDACIENNVPVMAHAGYSMGSTDADDEMAGPYGWKALLSRKENKGAPLINVGHFGGAADRKADWTAEFAALMSQSRGERLYADVAYWNELQCADVGQKKCAAAQSKLAGVLKLPEVAHRVMYGSDWLMLAQEPDWWSFPFDIAQATAHLDISQADLFGTNAKRCFASTFQA